MLDLGQYLKLLVCEELLSERDLEWNHEAILDGEQDNKNIEPHSKLALAPYNMPGNSFLLLHFLLFIRYV